MASNNINTTTNTGINKKMLIENAKKLMKTLHNEYNPWLNMKEIVKSIKLILEAEKFKKLPIEDKIKKEERIISSVLEIQNTINNKNSHLEECTQELSKLYSATEVKVILEKWHHYIETLSGKLQWLEIYYEKAKNHPSEESLENVYRSYDKWQAVLIEFLKRGLPYQSILFEEKK